MLNGGTISAAVVAFGLGALTVAAITDSHHPPPLLQHAAMVSKASRAFCNCLKTHADLQECLASAEQGDGREVNDQELLLSACLEKGPTRRLEDAPSP